NGLATENSFGDVVVAPQLMLDETETRSVSAIVAIRTPTGQTSTGNGKTIVTPTLAVWQDLPAAWQVRGGTGMDVATHAGEGPHEVLNFNLAAGNTLTRHDTLPFGDLTPYLSANLNQDLGSGKNFTDFSLTPGVRFFGGWHTYFITGVIVPVTNPKPFEPRLTAVVSRGWRMMIVAACFFTDIVASGLVWNGPSCLPLPLPDRSVKLEYAAGLARVRCYLMVPL